jgi:hypothetical protein
MGEYVVEHAPRDAKPVAVVLLFVQLVVCSPQISVRPCFFCEKHLCYSRTCLGSLANVNLLGTRECLILQFMQASHRNRMF